MTDAPTEVFARASGTCTVAAPGCSAGTEVVSGSARTCTSIWSTSRGAHTGSSRSPTASPLTELTQDVSWRELLPGWYDEWVLVEQERSRQLQLHVLEAASEELLFRHKPGPALDAALAAVQAEPLRESAHRLVIRIHLFEGNISEVIRHYTRYLRLLRDELGVTPTEQLVQLVAGSPMPEDARSRIADAQRR